MEIFQDKNSWLRVLSKDSKVKNFGYLPLLIILFHFPRQVKWQYRWLTSDDFTLTGTLPYIKFHSSSPASCRVVIIRNITTQVPRLALDYLARLYLLVTIKSASDSIATVSSSLPAINSISFSSITRTTFTSSVQLLNHGQRVTNSGKGKSMKR